MNGQSQAATISQRFGVASSFAPQSAAGVNAERSVEITAKRERVSEQAQSHFAKHRQRWTNRQYSKLLARDGERMTLRPPGMVDDRKTHLMRAADSMVLHRQAKRFAKIDRAAENMRGRSERDLTRDMGR